MEQSARRKTRRVIGGGRGRKLLLVLRDPTTALALAILLAALAASLFSAWLAPHSPATVNLPNRLVPPLGMGGNADFPLGTDAQGRDILSRIVFGIRSSLVIGFAIVVISGMFGSILGFIAGYRGGWVDAVVMRVVDAQIAFPGLLLVIVVIGVLGASIPTMIVVISIFGWPIYARLVRGSVLQLREELYVTASEFSGSRSSYVIRRHLLPNLLPLLMTQGMLELARVMLAEAGLSYLGLGIQPPAVSLGLMVAENQLYLQDGWWTVLFPGLSLSIIILSINLLTSWLRVVIDPQQRLMLLRRNRTDELKMGAT